MNRIRPDPRLSGSSLQNTPITIELTAAGWRVGDKRSEAASPPPADRRRRRAIVPIPSTKQTRADGPYRGLTSHPSRQRKLDLINEVDIDGYLAGVLPASCLKPWQEETYKAQAVGASHLRL